MFAGVCAVGGNLCGVVSLRTREYGVGAADLQAQRAALVEFAAEMYRPLVRCDQRAKGEQYVRGLLLEGRRKSIQPMAARLPDGDEEGLQQFITDSPWEDQPVRRRLARRMTAEIEPDGWIVDDTGLPKDGRIRLGWRTSTAERGEDRQLPGAGVGQRRDGPRVMPAGVAAVSAESWDEDEQRRAGHGSLRRCGTSRSGSSRWRSSTSCWTGGWSVGWCRPTAAMEISPRSGSGWRSASLSTSCKSRA